MNLDDRMKRYELSFNQHLIHRCPAICRVDGRAFHTFTRAFQKPFDGLFSSFMLKTAMHLCETISTARMAYAQSDEISVLLVDYTRFETDQFFDGRVQKLASVIASEATNAFNEALWRVVNHPVPAFAEIAEHLQGQLFRATFDARLFSVPERDAVNYFLWRQQDAVRNSIQALGQAHFSHKELQGKTCQDIQQMLIEKSKQQGDDPFVTWESQPESFKYGSVVYRTSSEPTEPNWTHMPAPIFAEQRHFVDQFLEPEEE
jgi:tRNA(His) 5'-end guanylyltransferase